MGVRFGGCCGFCRRRDSADEHEVFDTRADVFATEVLSATTRCAKRHLQQAQPPQPLRHWRAAYRPWKLDAHTVPKLRAHVTSALLEIAQEFRSDPTVIRVAGGIYGYLGTSYDQLGQKDKAQARDSAPGAADIAPAH